MFDFNVHRAVRKDGYQVNDYKSRTTDELLNDLINLGNAMSGLYDHEIVEVDEKIKIIKDEIKERINS